MDSAENVPIKPDLKGTNFEVQTRISNQAFKLLCGASSYEKVNEAVEKIMIRCIEAESLGLEPKGPDRKA